MRLFPVETYLLVFPVNNDLPIIIGNACTIIFTWNLISVLFLGSHILLVRANYELLEPISVVVYVFNLFIAGGTMAMSIALVKKRIMVTWLCWTFLCFILQIITCIVIVVGLKYDLYVGLTIGYNTKYILAVLEVCSNIIPFLFNWYLGVHSWLSLHCLYEQEYFKGVDKPLTSYEKVLIQRVEDVGDMVENEMAYVLNQRLSEREGVATAERIYQEDDRL